MLPFWQCHFGSLCRFGSLAHVPTGPANKIARSARFGTPFATLTLVVRVVRAALPGFRVKEIAMKRLRANLFVRIACIAGHINSRKWQNRVYRLANYVCPLR